MNMRLGWLRDLPDHRDYTQNHPTVNSILATAANSKRPPTKDLREFCSPVEDQMDLGSCTSQAGVGLMEWFQRRAYGKHLNMSRLFLYKVSRRLANLKGDSGSYLRSTMQAMVLVGVPPESMWPYSVRNFDNEPDAYTYALARRFEAFSYYRLAAAPGKPLLETLLSSLAGGLPFMFGFSVFSNISDDGWIPVPSPGVTFEGGHAVVAVGYDDTKQALLIRNSWGTGWGHCLAAGTMVSLLSGKEVAIEEVPENSWVYALDLSSRRMVPAQVRRTYQGIRNDIVRVTLDNGETVVCTEDHKWIAKDGSAVAASKLRPGTSLLPLYRTYKHGYEAFHTGTYKPITTHWSVVRYLGKRVEHGHVANCAGCRPVIHHADFNARNNNPDNLIPMWTCQHRVLHSYCSREGMRRGWRESGEERRDISRNNIQNYNEDLRSGIVTLTDSQRQARRENAIKRNTSGDSSSRQASAEKAAATRKNRYGDDVFRMMGRSSEKNGSAISATLRARYAAGELPVTDLQREARRRNGRKVADLQRAAHRKKLEVGSIEQNHKVVSVERLSVSIPVYDLEVSTPGCNAFALSAGVFVHNSGYGWLPYHYITEGLADDFWSLVKADFVDTDIFKV